MKFQKEITKKDKQSRENVQQANSTLLYNQTISQETTKNTVQSNKRFLDSRAKLQNKFQESSQSTEKTEVGQMGHPPPSNSYANNPDYRNNREVINIRDMNCSEDDRLKLNGFSTSQHDMLSGKLSSCHLKTLNQLQRSDYEDEEDDYEEDHNRARVFVKSDCASVSAGLKDISIVPVSSHNNQFNVKIADPINSFLSSKKVSQATDNPSQDSQLKTQFVQTQFVDQTTDMDLNLELETPKSNAPGTLTLQAVSSPTAANCNTFESSHHLALGKWQIQTLNMENQGNGGPNSQQCKPPFNGRYCRKLSHKHPKIQAFFTKRCQKSFKEQEKNNVEPPQAAPTPSLHFDITKLRPSADAAPRILRSTEAPRRDKRSGPRQQQVKARQGKKTALFNNKSPQQQQFVLDPVYNESYHIIDNQDKGAVVHHQKQGSEPPAPSNQNQKSLIPFTTRNNQKKFKKFQQLAFSSNTIDNGSSKKKQGYLTVPFSHRNSPIRAFPGPRPKKSDHFKTQKQPQAQLHQENITHTSIPAKVFTFQFKKAPQEVTQEAEKSQVSQQMAEQNQNPQQIAASNANNLQNSPQLHLSNPDLSAHTPDNSSKNKQNSDRKTSQNSKKTAYKRRADSKEQVFILPNVPAVPQQLPENSIYDNFDTNNNNNNEEMASKNAQKEVQKRNTLLIDLMKDNNFKCH